MAVSRCNRRWPTFRKSAAGRDAGYLWLQDGWTDFFVSTDSACEGQRILGIDGYGYKQPQAGLSLVPLYRCASGHDDFVSTNAECAGEDASPVLLGYALP